MYMLFLNKPENVIKNYRFKEKRVYRALKHYYTLHLPNSVLPAGRLISCKHFLVQRQQQKHSKKLWHMVKVNSRDTSKTVTVNFSAKHTVT